MSHPLYWPPQHSFHPIGNTPAISLTRDLSPEQSADILLLGCGHPRNILFTLYSDVTIDYVPRRMDITCCDIEPGILARNILFFSMLENNEPIDRVWDIFYHFKIDSHALKLLVDYSQKLYDAAESKLGWEIHMQNSSFKIVDTYTLGELRRCWKNYTEFPRLPSPRLEHLLKQQSSISQSIMREHNFNTTAPFMAEMFSETSTSSAQSLFQRYWSTGTTSMKSATNPAEHLNPTFLYSQSGEGFHLDHRSFPTSGFHLTPVFMATQSDPAGPLPDLGSAVINVSKQQFQAWCTAFRNSQAKNAITIRFYVGDALAFCRALKASANNHQPATGIIRSPWRGSQIDLSELTVPSSPTPSAFDVIDSSSLASSEELGLLNILIVTSPLLKKQPASQSLLYTETLLGEEELKPQSSFNVCASSPTLALLLGIAPRYSLSPNGTESDVQDISAGTSPLESQNYERMVWTSPSGGDHRVTKYSPILVFDVEGLAHVVWGIYRKMFANEHPKFFSMMFNQRPGIQYIDASMEVVHYRQETIALLFEALRDRIRIRDGYLYQVAKRFLELVQRHDGELTVITYQDLCLQLHLHGIYTVPPPGPDFHAAPRLDSRTKISKNQSNSPPAICVTLTIPNQSLRPLFDFQDREVQLSLRCVVTGGGRRDTYSVIHAVWGTCIKTPGSSVVTVCESPEGQRAQSDLVISFWIQTQFLEPPDTRISLKIKATPGACSVFAKDNMDRLEIFKTSPMDTNRVQLLKYCPTISSEIPRVLPGSVEHQTSNTESSEHLCQAIVDNLSRTNNDRIQALSLLLRLNVNDRERLIGGETPQSSIKSISPCTLQVSVTAKGNKYYVSYPYPISSGEPAIYISKTLDQLNVVVPVSDSSNLPGHPMNPFPIIRRHTFTPWNVHHIALDRMPLLDIQRGKKRWLKSRFAPSFSIRDFYHILGPSEGQELEPEPLADFRNSIRQIMMLCSGVTRDGKHTRTVVLCEPFEERIYAILLAGGVRLDLGASTVALDLAIIPFSKEHTIKTLPGIRNLRRTSVTKVLTATPEIAAWRVLFPALVERCRTWKHKTNCEYHKFGLIPVPLASMSGPICTCGQGVDFDGPVWDVPEWAGILPFATRAALSPTFPVSPLDPSIDKRNLLRLPSMNSQSSLPSRKNTWSFPGSSTRPFQNPTFQSLFGSAKRGMAVFRASAKIGWSLRRMMHM